MFPSRQQYKKWTLVTKLSYWGFWVGAASLFIAVIQIFLSSTAQYAERNSQDQVRAETVSVVDLATLAARQLIDSGIFRFGPVKPEGGKFAVMVSDFNNRTPQHIDMTRFRERVVQEVLDTGLAHVIEPPAYQTYYLEISGTLHAEVLQGENQNRQTEYSFVLKGLSPSGRQVGLWEASTTSE